MRNRMNSVVIFNAWHTCLVSTSLLWRGSRWRRGCRWRPRPGQTRPRTQSRRATCGGYAHQPPGHSGTPVAEIISIMGIETSIRARLSVCCSDCHNFKFHFPCSYLSSCQNFFFFLIESFCYWYHATAHIVHRYKFQQKWLGCWMLGCRMLGCLDAVLAGRDKN